MPEGIGETKKRTLWDDISESTVPLKAATLFGVGGATLNRTGAEVMDYILPPSVPAAAPGARRVQDANFAAFEKAWGSGDTSKPAVPAPAAAPEVPAPTPTPTPTQKEVVAATSPIEHPLAKRFADPYQALRAMDDSDFKHFVDNHGDALPGIGYVKNGKNIERIIQNPATNREADYELTNDQADKAIALLHGKATAAAGIGAKEAANDLKQQQIFDANLKLHSPLITSVDENGNTTKSYDEHAGLMKMVAMGKQIKDPRYADVVPEIQKKLAVVEQDFNKRYVELAKNNPKLRPLKDWTLSDKLENYFKSRNAAEK